MGTLMGTAVASLPACCHAYCACLSVCMPGCRRYSVPVRRQDGSNLEIGSAANKKKTLSWRAAAAASGMAEESAGEGRREQGDIHSDWEGGGEM